MTGVDETAETYCDRSGLDELRAEAFPLIAVSVVASAWLANVGALPNVPESSVILPVALAISGYAGYRLLSRGVWLASALFVFGLLTTAVTAIWIYPDTMLACLLAPVVLVTGLLLGPEFGGVVALLGSGAVVIGQSSSQGVVTAPTAAMALVLIWATAILSWLASRSVYLALEWSWHSYLKKRS